MSAGVFASRMSETERKNIMKDKIVLGGTFLLVLYHFICCGLPSLTLLLSGTSFFSVKKILSHAQMGYLLIFSGVLLGLSFYFTYKRNGCICTQKKISFCKVLLWVSALLYLTAVYFHIFPEDMTAGHVMYH